MKHIINITILGIFRDRVFQGIMFLSAAFLIIPIISTLSMRQVTELSVTLSLSLVSCVLFMLSVFLGGVSIWRDVEKRYTYSVLSLPITRSSYLMGRFFGVAAFIALTAIVLGAVSGGVIWGVSSLTPPDRLIVWENIWAALFFDTLKYILLVAFALLFSTFSTSFFLPVFGSIATFFIGNMNQDVFEYINSPSGIKAVSPFLRQLAGILYYIVPNFSAFNLKVNAIYGIPLKLEGLLLIFGYFVVYTSIVILIASIIFLNKEIK